MLKGLQADADFMFKLPNVTETTALKECLSQLQSNWSDMIELLSKKAKEAAERKRQSSAYLQQRDRVFSWLKQMEARVDALPAVPLDPQLIDERLRQLQPLANEHAQFQSEVDTLSRLGDIYVASLQSTVAREASRHSPTSATSSGFSSFDNLSAVGDLNSTQKELVDAKQRYELLGKRLTDRAAELSNTVERLRAYNDKRQQLDDWLLEQKTVIKDTPLPSDKETGEQLLTQVKTISKQGKERKSNYDQLKSEAHELTRLKSPNEVAGLEELRNKQASLDRNWDSLHDECQAAEQRLQNCALLLTSIKQMNRWLTAKEKMIGVMSNLGVDPKVIENQLMQVEVLKDEVEAHRPSLEQLNDSSHQLFSSLPAEGLPERRLLADQIADVNRRWDALEKQLTARTTALTSTKELGSNLISKVAAFK